MNRFILLLIVVISVIVFSCGNGGDSPTVIVITPNLPKIDCAARANQVAGDVAQRGLGTSPAGQQLIQQAKADCEAENRRRGY